MADPDLLRTAAGHDCTECGATVPSCDQTVAETGKGCCGACYVTDTHGLIGRPAESPFDLLTAGGTPDEPGDDDSAVPFPARRAMQVAIWEDCIRSGGNEWTTWSDAVILAETAARALTRAGWDVRAAAPASEDPPGVIFDGPPPRAIDVDPATIAPPVWGPPPPTPAPTREQVWDALAERWVAHGRALDTPGEAFVSECADAVMALWSTRPATVLWEGETRMVMHYDPRENGKDSFVPLPPEGFDVPPGTHVVVAVTEDPTDG